MFDDKSIKYKHSDRLKFINWSFILVKESLLEWGDLIGIYM